MRVGIVGWRGMVGSVLMQRMMEEGDFVLIEPTFFSTSAAGGKGPSIKGRETGPLQDASDVKALARQETIITCQGSDWTTAMYPKLREAGWNGYFIDAAKTLRMKDDAVIILDPVNRAVIDEALRKGVRNYIGTAWEVNDIGAELFARVFYTSLLDGESFGESVRRAREALWHERETYGALWAAYQHYGDPASSAVLAPEPAGNGD